MTDPLLHMIGLQLCKDFFSLRLSHFNYFLNYSIGMDYNGEKSSLSLPSPFQLEDRFILRTFVLDGFIISPILIVELFAVLQL